MVTAKSYASGHSSGLYGHMHALEREGDGSGKVDLFCKPIDANLAVTVVEFNMQ